MMIKEIASECGADRHTIARKLDTLELLGIVRKIQIGNAKRFFLSGLSTKLDLPEIYSDFIIVINERWEIQYINPPVKRLINLKESEIIGSRIDTLKSSIFSHPDVINGLKIFNPHEILKFEIPYNDIGLDRHYEISIMSLSINSGNILILIIVVDITKKFIFLQELMEHNDCLNSLFENSPIAINEEDFSALFIYLNSLLKKGITDLDLYFDNNLDELKKCVFMIKILKMNRKSREYYYGFSGFRDQKIPQFFNYLAEESMLMMKTVILSLHNGIVPSQVSLSIRTSKGHINFFVYYTLTNQHKSNITKVYASYLN